MLQCLFVSYTSDLTLRAHVDAYWVGDIFYHKSTSGFCVFPGDSLIPWKSKKQSVIACSTAKVEYCALAHLTAEAVRLRWPSSDVDVTLFP